MRRRLLWIALVVLSASGAYAQTEGTLLSSCTFDDGGQLAVRYKPIKAEKKVEFGKVLDADMFLFAQTPVTFKGHALPAGAYSLFALPNKDQWTLIINKNVTPSPYDASQDIVRADIETIKVDHPVEKLEIGLGHTGPKKCNFRLYYSDYATFTDFFQQ